MLLVRKKLLKKAQRKVVQKKLLKKVVQKENLKNKKNMGIFENAFGSKQTSSKTFSNNFEGLGTISVGQLMKMRFPTLHLKGEWKQFLGENVLPNFGLILSSRPGWGKSTFCLKFANYLQSNHGKVLYITNEECGKLIQDKLSRINETLNPHTKICFDCFDLESIEKKIQHVKPDFVFIDSMQNIGLDYKELAKLRKDFPQIGITAICYSTKDGKIRGNQAKEYQGDVTIIFPRKGTAQTDKNRFGESGRELVLFTCKEKEKSKKK